ncbi:MAG: sigma-70 family RNA polymerase sigma factor [Lentisphaeria bacterium]|nr:sigma-70 family RNA polymerase sigma factor [Lentisphaeria bacterium]
MTSSENHEAQFTAMIREHLPMFRGLAHRILGEPADVDDAVQTALLKAWQRRQTFRKEARLTSWVARIVINESYNLRRRSRQAAGVCLEDIGTPAPENDREQALRRLDQAISQLPEPYRQTVHIAILGGLDTKTAATMLDCSPNTLYQRIHKAKQLLREALKHE